MQSSEVEIFMGHNTYHHNFTEPVLKSSIAGKKNSNISVFKDSKKFINQNRAQRAQVGDSNASPIDYNIREWQDSEEAPYSPGTGR